jgi:hypothetical protein
MFLISIVLAACPVWPIACQCVLLQGRCLACMPRARGHGA